MSPSYFRIKVPLEEAKTRLLKWWGVNEPIEYIETVSTKAVELACTEDGQWRGGALFFYEKGEWSVFEDLSGGFGGVSAGSWAGFAQDDSFLFAGYNDSIPYGELIAFENGTVVREFLDYPDEPDENLDKGKLPIEEQTPIKSWIDIASFVDEDDLAFSESGWLWVNER